MDSQTKKELQRIQFAAAHMPIPQAPIGIIVMAFRLLMATLGWYTGPFEVFTQVPGSMGVRNITLLRLVMGYWVLSSFTSIVTLYQMISGGMSGLAWTAYSGRIGTLFDEGMGGFLYHIYLWAFIGFALWHFYVNWQRKRKGMRWHSTSNGYSWLEYLPWHFLRRIPYVGKHIHIDSFTISRFILPVTVYYAINAIGYFDGLLGWWFFIGACALLLQNNLAYAAMRGRTLDIIDARIESEYLNESLSGAHKRETAGFSVIPAPSGDTSGNDDVLDITATVRESLGLDDSEGDHDDSDSQ